MTNLESTVKIWKEYLNEVHDWERLIEGTQPKITGCGPVYELANPIDRSSESFAIADMRELEVTEPHYHTNETEIYIVLQGLGFVVVGRKRLHLQPGFVVVTYPETAHFVLPRKDLVLAVINAPPFKSENYVKLTNSNPAVGFDAKQFAQLAPDYQYS